MWLVVYFYYPETKNIPMEEMGRLFGDEVAGTLEDELKHHGHAAHAKLAQATEIEVRCCFFVPPCLLGAPG